MHTDKDRPGNTVAQDAWLRPGELLGPIVGPGSFGDINVERGAIGVDRPGNVWFAGQQGLVRFDGVNVTRFTFTEPFTFLSIAAGAGSVVYFATTTGLMRFETGVFTLFRAVDPEQGLAQLVTSPRGEAYLLGGDRTTIGVFEDVSVRVLRAGVDVPADLAVTTLGFDGAGELVIGAAGGVALRRAGTWSVVRGIDLRSTFAPTISAIASAGDVVWLATHAGVYEYRAGAFTLHRTAHPATCMCVDGDEVWIGMNHGGLGRLRAGELSVIEAAGTLLPHEDVTALVRGVDGRIWVLAGGQVAFIREGEIERLPG